MLTREPTVYTTLVLVTDQFSCDRIINSARMIADLTSTQVCVLSVMKEAKAANPQALEHLFMVAKANDALMTVEFSDNAYSTIVHFIREHRSVNVVTGLPSGKNSLLTRLWETQENVNFYMISPQGQVMEVLDGSLEASLTRSLNRSCIAPVSHAGSERI